MDDDNRGLNSDDMNIYDYNDNSLIDKHHHYHNKQQQHMYKNSTTINKSTPRAFPHSPPSSNHPSSKQSSSSSIKSLSIPYHHVPYLTLRFTTSEDEDDRRVINEGAINRYAIYWSRKPEGGMMGSEVGGGGGGGGGWEEQLETMFEIEGSTSSIEGSNAVADTMEVDNPPSSSSNPYKAGFIKRNLDDSITGTVCVLRSLSSLSCTIVGEGKVGVKVNTARKRKGGEDGVVKTSYRHTLTEEGKEEEEGKTEDVNKGGPGGGNGWNLEKGRVFFAGNTTFRCVDNGGGTGGNVVIEVLSNSQSAPSSGFEEQTMGDVIVVDRNVFTIGRSGEADYTVNDRELSRMHFAVTKEGGRGRLWDLGR